MKVDTDAISLNSDVHGTMWTCLRLTLCLTGHKNPLGGLE